jgi:hypothetical protein
VYSAFQGESRNIFISQQTGLTMRVCGIEIAGDEARLVLLDGQSRNFSHVNPRRITLQDDEQSGEVKAFLTTISAFFRENAVELVGIKKRSRGGKYAGGPTGFKIECLIQLCEDYNITLIAPQTVAASIRRHNPTVPTSICAYQTDAFQTAFALLQ